jgi:hypothetical protein
MEEGGDERAKLPIDFFGAAIISTQRDLIILFSK